MVRGLVSSVIRSCCPFVSPRSFDADRSPGRWSPGRWATDGIGAGKDTAGMTKRRHVLRSSVISSLFKLIVNST
eukprot:Skav223710  [mRNA]  locus=scaffold2564:15861:19065:- [translate_table: standard]